MAFLGMLAAILITVPRTPLYSAKTSLEILNTNNSFLNLSLVNPVLEDGGAWTLMTDIRTQLRILESDALNDRVFDRLMQAPNVQTPSDLNRMAAWRRALHLGVPPKRSKREDALRSVHVSASAVGQTRIVDVFCVSPDPQLAATWANALANEFIEQHIESRWKMTERTGVFLTRQLDEMRVKLERSETALQAYARKSGLMFTSDRKSVAEEKLLQIQKELSNAQADRALKQSVFEIAASAAPEGLSDVVKNGTLHEYSLKLTDLRRQRSDLFTIYTAANTRVARLDEQIRSLETAIETERANIVRRIENDYDEAVRREILLQVEYGNQADLVTEQSRQSIQYNILKREVESNRELYDSMLQKMKEGSVAAALRASNVRVVDVAKVPKFPFQPRIKLTAAIGMLGGALLGICLVLFRERTNRTLQQPGDAEFYLNLMELGAIPSGGASRQLANSKARGAGNGAPNGLRDQMEVVAWHNKPSPMAEAFRSALTSLLFSSSNGARPHVLLLTSAGPKEGKTTTVCNLSIAMAEVHQRILLIDADMRRPRLHDVFEVANERGLSTLLREREMTKSALQSSIQETAVPHLFLLPSGPSTSSAANLLHLPVMKELVDRLKEEFDMILIDTPPMLQIPDARAIGRLVDGVVLVIRAGHTTRDAALAARQQFEADGIEVTGVILNDWDPKTAPRGYYGYFETTSRYYAADSER